MNTTKLVQDRNIVTITYANPGEIVKVHKQRLNRPNQKTFYANIDANGNYDVQKGEILFTYKSAEPAWNDAIPMAITCMNWITKETNDPLPEGEACVKELNKHITILGICPRTITWDGTMGKLMDDPVGVNTGYTAVLNTGSGRIRSGDIVLAFPPKPEQGRQNAMDSFSSNAFNPSRKVLATESAQNASATCFDYTALATSNAMKQLMKMMYAIYDHIDHNRGNVGPLKKFLHEGDTDDLDFGVTMAFERMNTVEFNGRFNDEIQKLLIEALKPVAVAYLGMIGGNMVGIAQSNADKGGYFACQAVPSITSILTQLAYQ